MKKIPSWVLLALSVPLLWGLNSLLESHLNAYYLRIIVNCGIGIILALSLNLVNGCAGQFSLGHAGFMGVGAYVSAALTTYWAPPFFLTGFGIGVAILAGALVAGFAGYLVGLPSLRLRGDYLAIVTLGFGEIIRIIFLNIRALGGPRGLPLIPRQTDFFWVYLWVIVTFLCLYRLIRSSYGRAILSIRENEIAAESMGIRISHYKVVAFVISSFFAGVAGGLFAHFQGFIDPNTFNFNRSVEVVIMVVVGGMGSFSGAILGGAIVSVVPEILRNLDEMNGYLSLNAPGPLSTLFEQLHRIEFNKYRLVIFPALLIIVMLVRPRGIFGHLEIWDWWGRDRKKKRLIPPLPLTPETETV